MGTFLDFVRLTTRTPHEAYVRGAMRSRFNRHWGGIGRLTTRTFFGLAPARAAFSLEDRPDICFLPSALETRSDVIVTVFAGRAGAAYGTSDAGAALPADAREVPYADTLLVGRRGSAVNACMKSAGPGQT